MELQHETSKPFMPCLARAAAPKPGLLPCQAWCGLSHLPLLPGSELPADHYNGFIASLPLCHDCQGKGAPWWAIHDQGHLGC